MVATSELVVSFGGPEIRVGSRATMRCPWSSVKTRFVETTSMFVAARDFSCTRGQVDDLSAPLIKIEANVASITLLLITTQPMAACVIVRAGDGMKVTECD